MTMQVKNWYWLPLERKTDDNLRNRIQADREIGDELDAAECEAELSRRAAIRALDDLRIARWGKV